MIVDFNPFNLLGRTIVITGASSGIGRQCAIECSKMGATVILVARNYERLKDTFDNLVSDNNKIFCADLTSTDQVIDLSQKIGKEIGKIDGIVHCAGISTTLPFKSVSAEKIECFFRSNVFSAIELTRELCKVKFMNEGASIIFFSSVMGCVGESGKSLYSMTKGALIAAARSLACEFAKRKIRVNCVSPGAILTPINANLPHMTDPDLRKKLEDKHLLGFGQTEDIANAVIYLLSNASRWVTGQNLIVDGGYTAR